MTAPERYDREHLMEWARHTALAMSELALATRVVDPLEVLAMECQRLYCEVERLKAALAAAQPQGE